MVATTTPTVPKTLLEAVNELLRAIRMSSVNSLNAADLNEAASGAKSALDTCSVEIQSGGFEFNSEREMVIDADTNGFIVLPSNTLKVRSARNSYGTRLVQRGQRLYDPVKKTFVIGEAAKVDIVLALEFEYLSQSFRSWITALAARRWCLPQVPSSATFQYTQDFLDAAQSAALLEDATVRDDDLKDTSPHFYKMGKR